MLPSVLAHSSVVLIKHLQQILFAATISLDPLCWEHTQLVAVGPCAAFLLQECVSGYTNARRQVTQTEGCHTSVCSQVMVFVHARNATIRTAMGLIEMAKNHGETSFFQPEQGPDYGQCDKQVGVLARRPWSSSQLHTCSLCLWLCTGCCLLPFFLTPFHLGGFVV